MHFEATKIAPLVANITGAVWTTSERANLYMLSRARVSIIGQHKAAHCEATTDRAVSASIVYPLFEAAGATPSMSMHRYTSTSDGDYLKTLVAVVADCVYILIYKFQVCNVAHQQFRVLVSPKFKFKFIQ